MKHFLAMIFIAAVIAVVFGVIARDTTRGRAIYGLKVFAEFLGVGLVLGWTLYFLPL